MLALGEYRTKLLLMPTDRETFLERLAKDEPRLAVKYLAHLALQIDDTSNGESARCQIVSARVEHDESALAIAQARDAALRDKFMLLADAFYAEHIILAGHGADHGQARAICDVLFQQQAVRQA